MAAHRLKTHLAASFVTVTLVLALLIGLLGYLVIKRDVIDRAQREVSRALVAARQSYQAEIDRLGQAVGLIRCRGLVDLGRCRRAAGLHYLARVPVDQAERADSAIVRTAAATGAGVGGTRWVSLTELAVLDPNGERRLALEIKPTPHARPSARARLDGVLVKEYALPERDEAGRVRTVLFGGRIINGDYDFVDRMRGLVFGEDFYQGRPVGTVTIFQDDVRVATNVLDDQGRRAVGTRVSEEVYRRVVEEGRTWHARAFVVTDWYKTAYEPIRDIEGRIVGILYVGLLEAPYNAIATRVLWGFLAIVVGATLLVGALSFWLAAGIARPLSEVAEAAGRLSAGDFGVVVGCDSSVKEINSLGQAFNAMADGLRQREQWLKESNEKLRESNKSYVDLIAFVAHELKGILASAVMNVYSVRDGFLGMINFKQRKAIDSVARNLDYLGNVVRKFLSLGQIERGDLQLNRTEIRLRQDIFDRSLDTLGNLAERKGLKLAVDFEDDITVSADGDLLLIVANNLISNAIKYSNAGARVRVAGRRLDGQRARVEVFNESDPMTDDQIARLFRKFSRLDNAQTKRVKGTGLGLFISRQIVEAHGGRIWAEARADGNAFLFELPLEKTV